VKLDSLLGSIDTDAQAARRFISAWYKPDDLVTLIAIRDKRPNRPHVVAQALTASELVEALEGADGEELLSSWTLDSDSFWNLYVRVNPSKSAPADIFKPGGDDNVACVRGAWVDLDVKPHSFESQDTALNFLRGLAVWPTTVVLTGSGGVHAYWRLEEDLTVTHGRDLTRAWWSYLSEEAAKVGAEVDRLVDMSRMMRLPGSVRWPRAGEEKPPHPVTLHYVSDKSVPVKALREASAEANDRRVARVKAVNVADRERFTARREMTEAFAVSNEWSKLQLLANIEDAFARVYSWDEILTPRGWTYLRTDHSERREWARPGRDEKSATTDWPESPDVMSLLSSSEETGLFDLKEADVPLTKYRVMLRLAFNDDEAAMAKWAVEHVVYMMNQQ
jgi:hypothetical protein